MSGSHYHRIAAALRYLVQHAKEQPSLARAAAHLELSEAHFHRLFREWVGITPKDFLQVVTLAMARQLLANDASVLGASVELGLSGGGRLHDLFVTHEAMTPGAYKDGGAGLTIHWGLHPTPLGPALLASTERGLCELHLDPGPDAEAALRARWPAARLVEAPERVVDAAEEVSARMRGEPPGRRLALVLKGSAFQVKVWEALLRVPDGALITYQALAAATGCHGGARAVGQAVGANPIAYLIPCHRVIRATGVVGDYRWGAELKMALLGVEGARKRGRGA